MQTINFHLAYLLTKHECVIIPNFGAFVVSFQPGNMETGSGLLFPPSKIVGFNATLKHNDGLLANSLSREKDISYDKALFLIQQFVEDLTYRLKSQEIVHFPSLGNLRLSDGNKIIFILDGRLSCNALNFGLTNFYLPRLNEIEHSQQDILPSIEYTLNIYQLPLRKKVLKVVGTVAAVSLAFFLIATPLNNHSLQPQSAGIITFPMKVRKIAESKKDSIQISNSMETESKLHEPAITEDLGKSPTRQYYIIIASLPDIKSAEKALEKYKQQGFTSANVVSGDNRHRIYVSKFEEKNDAESFLLKFRQENPKHSNAWLLAQKTTSNN